MQHRSLPDSPARRLALLGAIGSALSLSAWNCRASESPSEKASLLPEAAAASSAVGRTIHLVYIENDLRQAGLLVAADRDATLVDYQYYEMARYLKDRAPLVFAANAVAGDVTIVAPPAGDEELKLDFPAGDPIVTMTAKSYSTRKKLFQTWANVVFGVRVLQPATAGARRSARAATNFGINMGPDPVLGVLRLNRLGPGFVDAMLVDLLDEMAARGELALPAAKAVRPPAAA